MPPALEWSVLIQTGTSAAATFTPQLYDDPTVQKDKVPLNAPLAAKAGDMVTWGNASADTHQPWPLQGNAAGAPPMAENPNTGFPIAGTTDVTTYFYARPILPDNSSTPQYVLPPAATLPVGAIINYCCKFHPDTERFQITIVG